MTSGTLLPPYNRKTVPTVTDTLFAHGTIKQNLVAVSMNPATSGHIASGELKFGDTDPTKYIGAISYSYVGAIT